ncbi:sporulation integral membrane protein YtvI [Virgibacillus sp. FSP13]
MYKQLSFQLLRFLFIVAIILSIIFFLKYTFVYLYPIFIAILFSFMINPGVTFLEKKLRFPRTLAVVTIIISVFAFALGCIVLLITEFIQGTTYLAEVIPTHFKSLVHYGEQFMETKILPVYHKVISFFHTLDPSQQETIQLNLEQIANKIATSGTVFLNNILLKIPSALSVIPNSFVVLTFIILATFFLTKDWSSMQRTFTNIIPASAKDSIIHIWKQLKRALFGFAKAQIILISLTALIIFIGLRIMDVDHALTIALITAVVDLFPYIGTGIIFIPWIVYLFLVSNYPMTISISILYMVIIVGRQILEPKLLSTSLGVNPLSVLIAVFLGMQIWGFFGLLLAPILLVLLNVLYQSGVFSQLWYFIKG